MSRQFWLFLVIGVAIVAAAASTIWFASKGNHLQLTGTILHVRVLSLSPDASLVVADFRVKNPSNIPFVVSDAELRLDPVSGDPKDGVELAKPDVDNVFKYEKLIGPKFNAVLGLQDRINPGQTIDRMVAARFEVPESAVKTRKAIQLHLMDVDGATAEIVEQP